ncbi:probable serine/threonine-protein kinase clkA [Sabethes cyaneus]|uniref:probable serine/threonine-protein kinase clkA n=1 Tax=Sabethes cyaneus TaxID=53552 RepID=UPI00237DB268|nr:probable serine/threonine-protein kinase clkA [Sabethes cyaneus]
MYEWIHSQDVNEESYAKAALRRHFLGGLQDSELAQAGKSQRDKPFPELLSWLQKENEEAQELRDINSRLRDGHWDQNARNSYRGNNRPKSNNTQYQGNRNEYAGNGNQNFRNGYYNNYNKNNNAFNNTGNRNNYNQRYEGDAGYGNNSAPNFNNNNNYNNRNNFWEYEAQNPQRRSGGFNSWQDRNDQATQNDKPCYMFSRCQTPKDDYRRKEARNPQFMAHRRGPTKKTAVSSRDNKVADLVIGVISKINTQDIIKGRALNKGSNFDYIVLQREVNEREDPSPKVMKEAMDRWGLTDIKVDDNHNLNSFTELRDRRIMARARARGDLQSQAALVNRNTQVIYGNNSNNENNNNSNMINNNNTNIAGGRINTPFRQIFNISSNENVRNSTNNNFDSNEEAETTLEGLDLDSRMDCDLLEHKQSPRAIGSDRINKLREAINLAHLPDKDFTEIKSILENFVDLFFFKGDRLTITDIAVHEIETSSNIPINKRQYRFPEATKRHINKEIEEMRAQGIIKPSTSPWNAPVLCVPKKPDADGNKKYRIVVDFRALNEPR